MSTTNWPTTTPFSSRHFHLEQLAVGVYAAIHAQEGWAICNAGIIDLGDRTLVFDAFNTPHAAKDLVNAAMYLTGRPAKMVINSHYHDDHIWGNQAFSPDVDIISTVKTRNLIITEGIAQVKFYNETAQNQLETLEAKITQTDDKTIRQQLKQFIVGYQGIIATLPILKLRLPNLTFNGEMTFHGSKRTARLLTYDGGHCGSDAILYLPEDRIIFMEDTLFIDCHPYLADGDPDMIQRILLEVKLMKPSILVPGHGPVGKIEHLDILDSYIHQLKALVGNAVNRGATKEEIAKIQIPPKYRHWNFPDFFSVNINFLYQRQLKTAEDN